MKSTNLCSSRVVPPAGEYVGWLAAPMDMPEAIVGGAGILHRRVPPFPRVDDSGVVLAEGSQGIILNVFTERAWRPWPGESVNETGNGMGR
jgi:hypothetical protein